MGSFKNVCCASQLPINNNDEVVAFILVKTAQEEWNNMQACYYPCGLWAPLFFPAYGRYNDAGALKEISSNSAPLLDFVTLTRNRFTFAPDTIENEARVPETIQALLKAVDRGRVGFQDNEGTRPTRLIMFHRQVYWDLLNSIGARRNGENEVGKVLNDKVEKMLADDVVQVSKSAIKKALPFQANKPIGPFTAPWDSVENQKLYEHAVNNLISNNYPGGSSSLTLSVVRFILIREAMSLLNKHWIPQHGYGSQSADYALQRTLQQSSTAIIDHALAVERAFCLEEDDENPDDVQDAEAELNWTNRLL